MTNEKDNTAQAPNGAQAESASRKTPESGKGAEGASQRARRPRNRRPKPAQGESAEARTAAEPAAHSDKNSKDATRSDRPVDTPRKNRPGRNGRTNGNDLTSNDRKSDSSRRATRGSHTTANKGRAETARPNSPAAGCRGWRGYLAQLAVVILGVAIALIGSGLLERLSQKRQEREVMRLVVEELRENRRLVAGCMEKLTRERRASEMLARYGYAADRIPADSLPCCDAVWSLCEMAPQTDAVEMLKGSGLFSTTNDRELLMQILDCYAGLNRFASHVAQYNAFKLDALKHCHASGKERVAPVDDPRGAWKAILEDAMCRSFIRNGTTWFGSDGYLESGLPCVESTIEAIDRKYGFE